MSSTATAFPRNSQNDLYKHLTYFKNPLYPWDIPSSNDILKDTECLSSQDVPRMSNGAWQWVS